MFDISPCVLYFSFPSPFLSSFPSYLPFFFYRKHAGTFIASTMPGATVRPCNFYFAASKWNRLFYPLCASSREFVIKRVVAMKLGTIYSFYRCKYAPSPQAELTVLAHCPLPRITTSQSNRKNVNPTSQVYIFYMCIDKFTTITVLVHPSCSVLRSNVQTFNEIVSIRVYRKFIIF